MENGTNIVYILFGLVCLGLLILLLSSFIGRFLYYHDELRHINMEITRTSGAERAHWEKKKKKLIRRLFYLR